jgi:hypothetical protein
VDRGRRELAAVRARVVDVDQEERCAGAHRLLRLAREEPCVDRRREREVHRAVVTPAAEVRLHRGEVVREVRVPRGVRELGEVDRALGRDVEVVRPRQIEERVLAAIEREHGDRGRRRGIIRARNC